MDKAKPKMDRVTVTFTGKVNPKTEAIKDSALNPETVPGITVQDGMLYRTEIPVKDE